MKKFLLFKSIRLYVVIVLIIIGSLYGFASAIYNQNQYYPAVGSQVIGEEQMFKAWNWQPSPFWFPSYLLCKIAQNTEGNWAGITYTKSGYLFHSQIDRFLYFTGSSMIGLLFGLMLSIGVIKFRTLHFHKNKENPVN